MTLAGQLVLLMVLGAVTRGRVGAGGEVTRAVIGVMAGPVLRLGVRHVGVGELVQGGGGSQDQGHQGEQEEGHDGTLSDDWR